MLLPLLVASSVLAADPSVPPLVASELSPPPMVVEQQVVTKPRSAKRGLLIAGTVTFASSYLLSVGVAALMEMVARSLPVVPAQTSSMTGLFVPIVGPIIAVADRRNQTTSAPLLVVDSLVQTAGLAMLIIGIALPAPDAKPATVWLVPTATPGGMGAAFGARF